MKRIVIHVLVIITESERNSHRKMEMGAIEKKIITHFIYDISMELEKKYAGIQKN